MKKIAIAFASMLVYTACQASELSIVGHGLSKHVDNHNFNEQNYGAGLRYQSGKYAIQTGSYRNSIRKNSGYVGIDWTLVHFNIANCVDIEAGLYAGVASGYKYNITPMLGVQSAIRCKSVFVRARLMPDPFYNSKAVGAVELGVVLLKF